MDVLKELVSQIKLFCRFDVAVVTKLEELELEVKKSREDYKSLRTSYQSLEQRYAQLMYIVADLKKSLQE